MWYLSWIAALLTTLSTTWQQRTESRNEYELPPSEDDG